MVVLSVAILNKKGKGMAIFGMKRCWNEQNVTQLKKQSIKKHTHTHTKSNEASEDTAMGKQHTFIETDEVRYIYQPMDTLYLLLITNMQSNIIEDLNTLRVIAKLVPEYCHGHDDEAVTKHAFDLVFATDEVITPMGYREQVTFKQIQSFMEMDSAEEKLTQIIEDVRFFLLPNFFSPCLYMSLSPHTHIFFHFSNNKQYCFMHTAQSKIHNQQEYMKKRAQEFDKARMKERGNSQKNFPGADYLSTLGGTFGIGNRSGKSGGDPPGTITTHGFGSDSMNSNAMNDRQGEKENESEEDHGVDKGKKGSSSSSSKKSQQRTKGLALTSKSKKSDALFTEAMKADEQTVSADMLEIVDRTRAAVDQSEDSRALAPFSFFSLLFLYKKKKACKKKQTLNCF
ncbi:hypothetical protein RFI_01442 [Reticulomyxa filosa]|uniref:Coatomer subunit delta n=1 Tax=Reticulomyxa filosa TaxID=46433 RepID=X6PBX9_RETFI|nr:hypothetical protein RFI_01442 [Reticulomyxa filosa]|eukprot:ETO35623.1 hypothetical protein RFI_01442 [Reticulomyxa filosa]